MNLQGKKNLIHAILDELATAETLGNNGKLQAISVIKELVKEYKHPKKPIKSDFTISSIKLLVCLTNSNINKLLKGLATLSEKALTELLQNR